MADQFELAFDNDASRVCLLQGGVKVCNGEQHDCQGDEVCRQGEAPTIGQPINQADCGRWQGSGRSDGCGCPSCSCTKILGGQGS